MLGQETQISVLIGNSYLSVGLEHAMSVPVLDSIASRTPDRTDLDLSATELRAVDVCEMARWHLVQSLFMNNRLILQIHLLQRTLNETLSKRLSPALHNRKHLGWMPLVLSIDKARGL